MKPNITLTAFLASLQQGKKTVKDKELMKLLANQTLKVGLPQFISLYENAPPEFQDYLIIKPGVAQHVSATQYDPVVKNIISVITQKQGITPEEYEFFKNHNILDLKTLMDLRKRKNFQDSGNLIEKLIQDKSPHDERFDALREFMGKYKEYYDKKEVFPVAELEVYKERLGLKKVDKEEIKKYRHVVVKNANGYGKYKKEAYTAKVKTINQKYFENMVGIFLNFITRYIQPDFLNILEVLDLDFLKTLEKSARLSPEDSKNVWANLVKTIDLKSYYENIPAKDKTSFVEAVEKIYNVISDQNSTKTKKTTTSWGYNSSYKKKSSIILDKSTQEGIKSLVDMVLAFKKAGLDYRVIEDTLNIFTAPLQTAWKSNKNGFDIVIENSGLIKTQTKEKKQLWEEFKVEVEKSKLNDLLGTVEAPRKIKLHKI